jgi:hypothetical protein
MKVPIFDTGRRLSGQARRIPVRDVVVIRIEHVEKPP